MFSFIMGLFSSTNPIGIFISKYKYIIIGIVVILIVGLIGYQYLTITNLESNIREHKLKIETLEKDNKRISDINNSNQEQFEKDKSALNKTIETNNQICSSKTMLLKKQLSLCAETTCINTQPGATVGNVQVLDTNSAKKHLVFYYEIVNEFNNRTLGSK